jgi:hypothetical protein
MACVNMNYKICLETVAAWQHILRTCPNVDLAVVCRTKEAMVNISSTFKTAGFRAHRLQAHAGQPRPVFLANLRQEVDLVVDPFRCPGHTTASDAYTAGVPVVSLHTDTFHGSVAHSLARTLGFSGELTARTPDEYIRKVTRLLTRPDALAALRARVRHQRRWNALYDPCRYMDHFWDGIRRALRNTKAGVPKGDIDVPAMARFGDPMAVRGSEFTVHDQTSRAVTKLVFDDTQIMVSPWHNEVWVGERCVTTALSVRPEAASEAGTETAPTSIREANKPLRFTRSGKGTCVLQGTTPVLLGIAFPTTVRCESGTLYDGVPQPRDANVSQDCVAIGQASHGSRTPGSQAVRESGSRPVRAGRSGHGQRAGSGRGTGRTERTGRTVDVSSQ